MSYPLATSFFDDAIAGKFGQIIILVTVGAPPASVFRLIGAVERPSKQLQRRYSKGNWYTATGRPAI
jgi:hypothetical protein